MYETSKLVLQKRYRELPNYNPIGVSSSASGKEHADTAEELWGRKEDEQEAGSGIEDVPDEPNERETSPSVLLDSGGSGASPHLAAKERQQAQSHSATTSPLFNVSSLPSSQTASHSKDRESSHMPAINHQSSLRSTSRQTEKVLNKRNARESQAAEGKMAKISLKHCKLELEYKERQQEQEAKHKKQEWEYQLKLAALQQTPTQGLGHLPQLQGGGSGGGIDMGSFGSFPAADSMTNLLGHQ
ncbi:hypothetical protein K439DRAFT_1619131 [Ramaria rubella]|nr:hypothetical protein K439DRAFT_1619131 [Ramaria rubella]